MLRTFKPWYLFLSPPLLFRRCWSYIHNMKWGPEREQQDSAGSQRLSWSPWGHQSSRPLSLLPMVELNQRAGQDPSNTREPTIKRLTQTIALAPSIGLEKHTFCSASMLIVTCNWVKRKKSIEHGLDSVWTAPPWGGQKQYCSLVRSRRRKMLACSSSPVRRRPLPSLTQSGPCTSTTACGIFEIQNSTSDSKRGRGKQSYQDAEGSLGCPVFSEHSCSVLDGKKYIDFCFVCIYCLHNDATFKGYRNVLISGMNYGISCKALAVYQLYISHQPSG